MFFFDRFPWQCYKEYNNLPPVTQTEESKWVQKIETKKNWCEIDKDADLYHNLFHHANEPSGENTIQRE